MRILFWSEQYRPAIGGVELWTEDLIAALQARGHEAAVITCHAHEGGLQRDLYDATPVYRLPFQRTLMRRHMPAVKRMVDATVGVFADFGPDVVHLNTSQPSAFFADRALKARPTPWLFTVHEPPLLEPGSPLAGQGGNQLVARLLKRAGWVAGISQAMLDDARLLVPEITARSSLVRNAIPTRPQPPPPREPDAGFLLGVGRLTPEKGFDLLLRAYAEVAGAHAPGLLIAGDGPARADLERLTESLGLMSRVVFTGWAEPARVRMLMQDAIAVVVPSRHREPFGLVALEAAASGRPVIAARTGGLAEIVAHGTTGWLFEPGDRHTLGDALRALLADRAGAAAMGAAAYERACGQFRYEPFVDAYERLYAELSGCREPQIGAVR